MTLLMADFTFNRMTTEKAFETSFKPISKRPAMTRASGYRIQHRNLPTLRARDKPDKA